MSDPAPTSPPTPPAPPPPAAPPKPARWLDRLSLLLLCVSAAGLLAAAAPSLVRAPRAEDPPGAGAVSAAPSSEASGVITFADRPPRFAPPDDPPRLTELERAYPDGMWPGHGTHPDRPPSPRPTSEPWQGRARAALTLHGEADAAAPTLGHVKAGEPVTVLREQGGWALIMYTGAGSVIGGWTKLAGIAR